MPESTQSDRQSLPKKIQHAAEQMFLLLPAFRLVWAAAKGWTIAWTILLILQGVLPAITVYFTRFVVDSLVAAIKVGATWESFSILLAPSIVMAGVLVLLPRAEIG